MLEYEFVTVPSAKGVFLGKTEGHRNIIRQKAAEGWRYMGWVPSKQASGFITELDLIFEREGQT